jgi:Mlc titration factor MtfA (ptsG expression regulator)
MRVEYAGDRRFALGLSLLATAAFAAVGGAAAGAWGSALLAGFGLLVGLGLRRRVLRRAERRRAVLAAPFPERWRSLLLERYDHYERLPAALRGRFEADLLLLLAEKRITGVGVPVTDELRLLVAASAVTLSLGWPDYEWDQLSEVLLYPQDFDRDYGFECPELAGEAHPWGTVILSVPALLESFLDPDDAYHVGIHEFAHLLDVEQTQFHGIPSGLDPRRHAEWLELVESESERLRKGKSVLDPYGTESAVEFLAVAVEAFFEAPLALRQRHRELYAMLSGYFAQDPAAWDDARGLAL